MTMFRSDDGQLSGHDPQADPFRFLGHGNRTTGPSTPLSQYLLNDSRLMEVRGSAQMSPTQDFAFDYRSFATSTEAMFATPDIFDTMHTASN